MGKNLSYILLFAFILFSTACNDDENADTIIFDRSTPINLISKIKISYDCNGCTDIYEEIWSYNSDNLIDNIKYNLGLITHESITDTFSFTYTYKYDLDKRPIQRITSSFSNRVDFDTITYTYSGNNIEASKLVQEGNLIISSIELNPDLSPGKIESWGSIYTYNWDQKNVKLITIDYGSDSYHTVQKETSQEFINKINPLAYSSLFSLNPTSSKLISQFETKTILRNPDTTIITHGSYDYTFNNQGLPDKATKNYELLVVTSDWQNPDAPNIISIEDMTTTYTYEYKN